MAASLAGLGLSLFLVAAAPAQQPASAPAAGSQQDNGASSASADQAAPRKVLKYRQTPHGIEWYLEEEKPTGQPARDPRVAAQAARQATPPSAPAGRTAAERVVGATPAAPGYRQAQLPLPPGSRAANQIGYWNDAPANQQASRPQASDVVPVQHHLVFEKDADRTAPALPASQPYPDSRYTQLRPPGTGTGVSDEDITVYQVPREPPGPTRLYRAESEADLFERIREEHKPLTKKRIPFPEEPRLETGAYKARPFPPVCRVVEAHHVVSARGYTYFEELNAERYGWDLGVLQPFLQAGIFYKDLLCWPYQWGQDPCRWCEWNTGYCLPGDPVPYLIYPPGCSVTGAVAEASTLMAFLAIFP
jgi:hypothetical protein